MVFYYSLHSLAKLSIITMLVELSTAMYLTDTANVTAKATISPTEQSLEETCYEFSAVFMPPLRKKNGFF